jgi:NAD(P)-dependent dehydrogenase (short-subunit alcohol dehydrogenase family)
MELGLSGKAALITGASRGIGRAIAEALAREGVRSALVARNETMAEVAVAIGARYSCEVEAIIADLATEVGVRLAISRTAERFGRIDILVNNAGAIRTAPFLDMPVSQWAEDWALKPLGYVRMAQAVFPIMQAQGGGRIINIAGAAARNPVPTYLAGAAANAALINFTKGLADLGAPYGILVNAVSPAATRTERLEAQIRAKAAASGRSVAEEWAERQAAYSLGRIASPSDVADLVCFLVSERASFLTGISIAVDGGSSRGVYL